MQKRWIWLLSWIVLLLVGGCGIQTNSSPDTSSTSTPAGISPAAQQALDYIAKRENIPVAQLIVVNDIPRPASLLERTYQAVTILDQTSGRFFQALVDQESGQIEEPATVEQAEEAARAARYGKLEPALHTRLQQIQDTDPVTVTIIVAAGPGQSLGEREQAAFAALAAKYPEAREAVENNRQPMDVDDPVLAEQIYKEYVALIKADMPQNVQPVVDELAAQGYAAHTSPGLPAVTATIPKRVIMELAQRKDVGMILLNEAQGQPASEEPTAMPLSPDQQALSFTTIAQDSVMGSYRDVATPELFVIANVQEAQDIAKQILEADPQFQDQRQRMAEQLSQVDFQGSFALVVTPGIAISGTYGITVQQIIRQGDEITVRAERQSWRPGEARPAVATDPVHIVAVAKDGVWAREILFRYFVDGTLAVEVAHRIP